jgi:hypothetical protein
MVRCAGSEAKKHRRTHERSGSLFRLPFPGGVKPSERMGLTWMQRDWGTLHEYVFKHDLGAKKSNMGSLVKDSDRGLEVAFGLSFSWRLSGGFHVVRGEPCHCGDILDAIAFVRTRTLLTSGYACHLAMTMKTLTIDHDPCSFGESIHPKSNPISRISAWSIHMSMCYTTWLQQDIRPV